MKLRYAVVFCTVCWLGIMIHCVWPPGYGRAGEIAIIGIVFLTGCFVLATVRSVERENARRRRQRRDRTPPRHLHSVPSLPVAREEPEPRRRH